jgi:hypothetical protein
MNTINAPVVGYLPKIIEPACFQAISLFDKGIRTLFGQQATIWGSSPYSNNWYIDETAKLYGCDISKYMPELAAWNRDIGGLVQIRIPKEMVHGIYESAPFGRACGTKSMQEKFEEMQSSQHCNVDAQVRIPLYQSTFGNPESGIEMEMIVFANKEEFEHCLMRMSQIVDELYEE